MECMPKNAFQDIYTCLHVDDDWDRDNEWGDVYSDSKTCSLEGTAKHRQKFSMFEESFNRRWKECTIFGRWLTLMRAVLRTGTTAPSRKGQIQSPFAPAQQSTLWQ
jgi:hypothetical protein